jgi:hypothetical protein
VRRALFERLVRPRERDFLITLLADLSDKERWRAGDGATPVPLPPDALFPLLDLGRRPDADAKAHAFILGQLPHVPQDLGALSSLLAAMQRGGLAWLPGAEPWMAERLRLLMERRVSFTLADADLDVVIAERFAGENVVIDPWVVAAAPPPVTLELKDARVIDALLTLTRMTGTHLHLHLSCDAVLVVDPRVAACDGFVPTPAIGLAPGFDRTHPAFADRQARLQAKHDLVCVDVPFAQAIADLAGRSGVPISFVEPEGSLSTDLRQVSLDHAIRLIARLHRLVAVQDAVGIHLHPER